MTIKEVEVLLEIPRASVRFYEKEGLISPARGSNSYREYSEEDVAVLKRIIIFRKLGISVDDIKGLLNGEMSLEEQLSKNIVDLKNKICELEGAINVCELMQTENASMDNFNENYYWDKIHTEEMAGNKFLEIINDVITFEKNTILKEFELINDKGEMIYGWKESIIRAFGSCIFTGVLWCIFNGWKVKVFIEGFMCPFVFIIIASIFGLPVYFIGKKHPNVANALKKDWNRDWHSVNIIFITIMYIWRGRINNTCIYSYTELSLSRYLSYFFTGGKFAL